MKRFLTLLFLYLGFFYSFGQTAEIIGKVVDSGGFPLPGITVVLKSKSSAPVTKFAQTNTLGEFKFEVNSLQDHELRITKIGFQPIVTEVKKGFQNSELVFELISDDVILDEVLIIQTPPIVIKRDSVIFNVDSFAKGDELKLKEILEKLPGIEIDHSGVVRYNGKLITDLKIENKDFFGGNVKLGSENIPAQVLDKIEILDSYTELGFMKEITGSDRVAMNIKLKEESKQFIFGDSEVGGNANDLYKVNNFLYFFALKLQAGFITNFNNVGIAPLNYSDLLRMQGGSQQFSLNSTTQSLLPLINENTDYLKHSTQFISTNFHYDLTRKTSVSNLILYNKIKHEGSRESFIDYYNPNLNLFEQKTINTNSANESLLIDTKVNHKKSQSEQIDYGINFQITRNHSSNLIHSISEEATNELNLNNDNFLMNLTQYWDWNKKLSAKNIVSAALQHQFSNQKIGDDWLSDQNIWTDLPMVEEWSYRLNQNRKMKTHQLSGVFNHFWMPLPNHHFYGSVGTNYKRESSDYQLAQQDIGETNAQIEFYENSKGPKFNIIDTYLSLEYRYNWKKLTTKFSVWGHYYHWNLDQSENSVQSTYFLLEPKWKSEIRFSNTHQISLDYALKHNFPDFLQLWDHKHLESYQSTVQGNSNLGYEKFHHIFGRHSLNSLKLGLRFNSTFSYTYKNKSIKREVNYDDVSRFSQFYLMNLPDNGLNFRLALSKKIYAFQFSINSRFSKNRHSQKIEEITQKVTRSSQQVGLEIRTTNKTWPVISLRYDKAFHQVSSFQNTKFSTDLLSFNFSHSIFNKWKLKLDNDWRFFKNQDLGNRDKYLLANASLEYMNFKKLPIDFMLEFKNLLNKSFKSEMSITEFYSLESRTYVMPRSVLFSIRYRW